MEDPAFIMKRPVFAGKYCPKKFYRRNILLADFLFL